MTNKKTSQSETQEVAETQKTQKNSINDNKTVFGPLGKYAIIAVIMVSIIVTTAIMLNKELGTVEQQVAEMQSQVASMNDASESADLSTVVAEPVSIETAASDTLVADMPVIEVTTEKQEAPVIMETAIEDQPAEISNTDTVAQLSTAAVSTASVSTKQAAEKLQATATSQQPQLQKPRQMTYEQAMEARAAENQARIETYKLEQKQRMAEMFARIKTLESNQLAEYKESQDKQIERLREQIVQQQAMIEELIIRNKEKLEYRETSLQRSQSKREEILNRI